jgi:hypothetical protein
LPKQHVSRGATRQDETGQRDEAAYIAISSTSDAESFFYYPGIDIEKAPGKNVHFSARMLVRPRNGV